MNKLFDDSGKETKPNAGYSSHWRGNMLAKQLQYLAGADAAGMVLGARVPIILTSRADNVRTRLVSAAVMKLAVQAARRGKCDPAS